MMIIIIIIITDGYIMGMGVLIGVGKNDRGRSASRLLATHRLVGLIPMVTVIIQ